MSGIEVITEDLSDHPQCAHGPTILFSRVVDGKPTKFFACSACRDRKDCSFFLWEDEKNKVSKAKLNAWDRQIKEFIGKVNHRKLFLNYNKIRQLNESRRFFCHTCGVLDSNEFLSKHKDHVVKNNISDHELCSPSELFLPLDNPKKEAQFLFAKVAVNTIVDIFKDLKYRNILCIGTPRIHEHITNEISEMSSLLMDIDKRYLQFFGPLQFCWYNSFNHHFFTKEAEEVFKDFLGSKNIAVIMDPPFGGRVESLAQTVKTLNTLYKKMNNVKTDLPVFWVFPYFMEPQIKNSLPEFTMMDYKVDYDNHSLFKNAPKGRNFGSPVRIFTNIDVRLVKLPEEQGYKLCKKCRKYVALENSHCNKCKECTSKDGRTYVHCDICKRCVKPTWKHCLDCGRCCQIDHKCGEVREFNQTCFHCHRRGHKKRHCPSLNHEEPLGKKRKVVGKIKRKKKRAKVMTT